jgi:enediyne biosynthesis protein E4
VTLLKTRLLRTTLVGTLVSLSLCGTASVLTAPAISFNDVTTAAGIKFTHFTGGFGKKYLPETMGSGCAFFDFDGDGWADILLLNGSDLGVPKRRATNPALYRNNRNGTFTDVTRAAGLAVDMYAMAATLGDYDNDGDDDLYVSCLGPDRLFQNQGKGIFKDVTAATGLGCSDFGASAAWLDYDRDGWLDLYVANYVEWTAATDIYCTLDGKSKSYCTPESYKGVSGRLYRNLKGSRFQDMTRTAGVFLPSQKGLGVCVTDADLDGWPDIVVANDTEPNNLFLNQKNGSFKDVGVASGIAFSEEGVARGAMGIDAADYDLSGRSSLVIGNFSNQMLALYHNEGKAFFIDEAPVSEIGHKSLLTLAFGCFFFDFDLDGWVDIFVANGHVENEINKVQSKVTYAQPTHLFRNLGKKQFQQVTAHVGGALVKPYVGRGSAYADFDRDGDLDILMTTNGGTAHLFRNDGGSQSRFIRIRLRGSRSNRNGYGTLVQLTWGGKTQTAFTRSGHSYLSQSESVQTFGIGSATRAEKVRLVWPSGAVQELGAFEAGKEYLVDESRGVVAQ